MADRLWHFVPSVDTKRTVPFLVPAGVKSVMASKQQFSPVGVDVVNNFFWTDSKKKAADGSGREEVPTIYLKERRVKANSYIAQLIYSSGAGIEGLQRIIGTLSDLGKAFGQDIGGVTLPGADRITLRDVATETPNTTIATLGTRFISGLASTIVSVASSFGEKVSKTDVYQTLLKKIDIQDDPNFLTQGWLQSYKGLYITEPTGWNFNIPFFQESAGDVSNTWGGAGTNHAGDFLVGEFANLFEGLGKRVGTGSTIFETGAYQEKSHHFNFRQEGEAVTFTFPLINTGNATYDDVVRNWQLIFLLLFNNRHERIDKNLVEIPPIYEARIPGNRYLPLTYMSNINVSFKGSTRTMKLSIPGGALRDNLPGTNFEFEAIVPEAYMISITLKSLVAESKNFMYSSLVDNNNIRVFEKREDFLNTKNSPIPNKP